MNHRHRKIAARPLQPTPSAAIWTRGRSSPRLRRSGRRASSMAGMARSLMKPEGPYPGLSRTSTIASRRRRWGLSGDSWPGQGWTRCATGRSSPGRKLPLAGRRALHPRRGNDSGGFDADLHPPRRAGGPGPAGRPRPARGRACPDQVADGHPYPDGNFHTRNIREFWPPMSSRLRAAGCDPVPQQCLACCRCRRSSAACRPARCKSARSC